MVIVSIGRFGSLSMEYQQEYVDKEVARQEAIAGLREFFHLSLTQPEIIHFCFDSITDSRTGPFVARVGGRIKLGKLNLEQIVHTLHEHNWVEAGHHYYSHRSVLTKGKVIIELPQEDYLCVHISTITLVEERVDCEPGFFQTYDVETRIPLLETSLQDVTALFIAEE